MPPRILVELQAAKKILKPVMNFCKACGGDTTKEEMKVIIDGVFNHCGSFNKMALIENIYIAAAKDDYAGCLWRNKESPYHSF